MRLAFALALLAAPLVACTTDIRPEVIAEDGITPESAAEGRAWLDKMVTAHGGVDAFKAHRDAEVVFTDTWPAWLTRTAAMPWPQNGQRIRMSLSTTTDDARLTFVGGELDGHTWGLQNWVTYTIEPGKSPAFEDDDDLRFWVPTMAYFFAMPWRIVEAGVVGYAGQQTIDGRPHAVVYATWGSAEPQDDIDQYVLYIDAETHRLTHAAYTVRELVLASQSAVRFSDFREVQGLVVPHTLTMVEEFGSDAVLHLMKLESVQFATGKPPTHLVPDPAREAAK